MTKEPCHTDWDSDYSEDQLPGSIAKCILSFILLTFQFSFFFQQYADRTYPLLILGSLMFIPGFYHVRIAYYAWKGYRGYSFEDIPDFDWLHGSIYPSAASHVKYRSDGGMPPVISATLKNGRNQRHGLDNRVERKQHASCCHYQKFWRKQISHQMAWKDLYSDNISPICRSVYFDNQHNLDRGRW